MKKDKFKVLLVYPNVPGSTLLPIGIASLSASLKANDIDVMLFDCTFYDDGSMDNFEQKKVELLQVKPFKPSWKSKGNQRDMIVDFQDMVYDHKPDLIGVSVVEDTIDQALSLLRSMELPPERKHSVPVSFGGIGSVPIIVGGVGVNWNLARLFDSGLVDLVCIGEGEEALVEVCGQFKNYQGKIPKNIVTYGNYKTGLIFVDGQLPSQREPLDINKLPFPDYSIFPKERMIRIMQGKEYRML